jgi:hypothetical protein
MTPDLLDRRRDARSCLGELLLRSEAVVDGGGRQPRILLGSALIRSLEDLGVEVFEIRYSANPTRLELWRIELADDRNLSFSTKNNNIALWNFDGVEAWGVESVVEKLHPKRGEK